MTAYFLRRLLLVPVTFLAITALVYTILRYVPGGPIEQAEAAMRLGAMAGEAGGGGGAGLFRGETALDLDEEGLLELQRFYALDQPVAIGYLQWLGLWPRERRTRVPPSTRERHPEPFQALEELNAARVRTGERLAALLAEHGLVALRGEVWRPLAGAEELPAAVRDRAEQLRAAGFGKRDELMELLLAHGHAYAGGSYLRQAGAELRAQAPELHAQAERLLGALRLAEEHLRRVREQYGFEIERDGRLYKVERRLAGILQLEFGDSYTQGEPVLGLIASKFEISLQFGLAGYLLTWLVCIPLGIFKALKHRSLFDAASSLLVFLGYALPGFVVALLLLATVAPALGLPLGGYKPEGIEQMGWLEAAWGRFRHMVIPVTAYVAGGFATMTILMKNSLMENLGADYVRTAFAKGLGERRVIFIHALRNSLIPITAGIGHAIGLLFAGSFLIELTCNIPGMGLLGYTAIIQRDYPIVLGILVFGVLIRLFGNILSDLVWALIDPRIRFGR
ncbi:MAG: hypothetical protein KatS3mg102_1182 [Planctomycetota bacterium]|nr:MAG: hypothetical protein KatS3mg102_1182 [Planctomycetota bacterium]